MQKEKSGPNDHSHFLYKKIKRKQKIFDQVLKSSAVKA